MDEILYIQTLEYGVDNYEIPIQIFLPDQFIPMPEEVKRGTDRSKKTQETG